MRRSTNRKRKVEELEQDSELLKELLVAIRGSGDGQVAQVVSVIRSNAPIEEVRRCIKQQIVDMRLGNRERSPELEHLMSRVNELQRRPRHRPLDIARLTDEPPFRVPAAPWTNVTTDDILVSNLISVWLTWDRPYYNWVHEELFLRDMKRGNLDCRYCSPFLVNALCASACFYSDYDEARAEGGAPSALFLCFLGEARRLREKTVVDDNNRMTMAQGLGALMIGLSARGDDAPGVECLMEAAKLCEDLDVGHSPGDVTNPEYQMACDAVDLTCWGIFNLTVLASMAYHAPPQIPIPSKPRPRLVQHKQNVRLYPLRHQFDSFHSAEISHYQAAAWVIGHDMLTSFYGTRADDLDDTNLVAELRRLHARVEAQRQLLPQHLQAESQTPSPAMLLHATDYPCFSLAIIERLAQLGPDKMSSDTQSWAHDTREKAALDIVDVCRLYNSLYGNTHVNLRLSHSIFVALHALLELQTPPLEDESTKSVAGRYQDEILDLCIFFRAMTRRFPWVMAAFRMFQVMAQQRGEGALPFETKKLFEEFEKQDWEGREFKRVLSLYPIPLESFNSATDRTGAGTENSVTTMGEFFSQLENLTIDDNEPR